MTYLELLQQAHHNCRLAGPEPSTIAGHSGVLGRLSGWVRDAYVDIQNRNPNWRWMRHECSLDTVADQSVYTYTAATDVETAATITRFARWRADDLEDPPKCYLKDTGIGGEYWLSWSPWEHYKAVYRINMNSTTTSNPANISIDSLNRLVIGPVPSDVYVITLDYHMSAQVLALDADVPDFPSHFHMLIVYHAMQKYGFTEGSSETLIRGQTEGNRMMRQLEADQGARIRLGRPMA